MELFNRLARYFSDQATAREARDMEAQQREQAQTTGDIGKALDLEYKAETSRRRKEAAQGRSGGLD